MLVATFKAGLVAAILCICCRKTAHLSHPHFYGFLCARLWLIFSRGRLSGHSLNVHLKVSTLFHYFRTLLALGIGAWERGSISEGARFIWPAQSAQFSLAVALVVYGVWFYRKMKRLRRIT